jgi:hypothetical protein
MQSFENIRTRLIGNASARFHCRPEELAQETRLFIDWMAWEIYSLGQELGRSNDYIKNKIQKQLMPDVQTRSFPAHSIAQAMPKEEFGILKAEEDIFTIPRLGKNPPHQIYFAPLFDTQIVPARVKYLVSGKEWFVVNGPLEKQQIATAKEGNLHPSVLWVGIEWKNEVQEEQDLCFFIDWDHLEEGKNEALIQRLHLIKWLQNETECKAEIAFSRLTKDAQEAKPKILDAEFLHIHAVEHQILRQYEKQFATVRSKKPILDVAPEEVLNKFDQDDLGETVNEKLLWMKLVFPAGFTPDDIRRIQINLNSFPIVNRKLEKSKDFDPSNSEGIEINALSNAGTGRSALADSGDFFLGMQRVFSKKQEYRLVTYEDFKDVPPGYYSLQKGYVEEADYRDVQNRIDELLQTVKKYGAVMNLGAPHHINDALNTIESGIHNLEDALKLNPRKDSDSGYYLYIKPLDLLEMIYVRFWMTQGKFAKGVARPGEMLIGEGVVLLGEVKA